MLHSPLVPSSSAPESTTPIARSSYTYAADRNSASIDGRKRFSFGLFFTGKWFFSINR
jgi:hypothetical protein